jgi:hypothetical protein
MLSDELDRLVRELTTHAHRLHQEIDEAAASDIYTPQQLAAAREGLAKLDDAIRVVNQVRRSIDATKP